MRLSHIADSEQKTVLHVSLADDRVTTEHQRVSSLLRSRQLGEDDSGHERLDEDAETRLNHEDDERRHAVRLDDSVPDGG